MARSDSEMASALCYTDVGTRPMPPGSVGSREPGRTLDSVAALPHSDPATVDSVPVIAASAAAAAVAVLPAAGFLRAAAQKRASLRPQASGLQSTPPAVGATPALRKTFAWSHRS